MGVVDFPITKCVCFSQRCQALKDLLFILTFVTATNQYLFVILPTNQADILIPLVILQPIPPLSASSTVFTIAPKVNNDSRVQRMVISIPAFRLCVVVGSRGWDGDLGGQRLPCVVKLESKRARMIFVSAEMDAV